MVIICGNHDNGKTVCGKPTKGRNYETLTGMWDKMTCPECWEKAPEHVRGYFKAEYRAVQQLSGPPVQDDEAEAW